MRTVPKRLTYANVVATLALFVAVATGGAYAAAQIGAGDIKRNAVRAKHIKPRSVTGAKLAAGAVRSRQVRRAAIRSRHLAGVHLISPIRATPTGGISPVTAREAAPEVPLLKRGPLTIYGKCFLDVGGGPTLYAGTYVKTSADGATLDGYDTLTGGSSVNNFLNVQTPETSRELTDDETVVPGAARGDNGFSAGSQSVLGRFTVTAPGGRILHGTIVRGVKQGAAAPFGGGAFGPDDGCTWSGYAIG